MAFLACKGKGEHGSKRTDETEWRWSKPVLSARAMESVTTRWCTVVHKDMCALPGCGERAARVPTPGGVAGERSWRIMLTLKYWTEGRKAAGAQITQSRHGRVATRRTKYGVSVGWAALVGLPSHDICFTPKGITPTSGGVISGFIVGNRCC